MANRLHFSTLSLGNAEALARSAATDVAAAVSAETDADRIRREVMAMLTFSKKSRPEQIEVEDTEQQKRDVEQVALELFNSGEQAILGTGNGGNQ